MSGSYKPHFSAIGTFGDPGAETFYLELATGPGPASVTVTWPDGVQQTDEPYVVPGPPEFEATYSYRQFEGRFESRRYGVIGDGLADVYRVVATAHYAGAPSQTVELYAFDDRAATEGMVHYGRGTSDAIHGGSGNDRFSGRGGDDLIFGNGGDDYLDGGDGDDQLQGGAGNDTLVGGDGNDHLTGDEPNGMSGQDLIRGGRGNDYITLGFGGGTARGEEGDDHITSGNFTSMATRSGSGDLLDGGVGNDTLLGSQADDILRGGDGRDSLQGGAGNDLLDGGAGDDRLEGDAPWLLSHGGSDTLRGGAGNDLLAGGFGDDRLTGGTGEDTLWGGLGADGIILEADGERDFVRYTSATEGVDRISGFELGTDQIVLEFLGSAGFAEAHFLASAAPRAQGGGIWILYNTVSGRLSVDMDGSGAERAILIASFAERPALGFDDLAFGF